MNLFFFIVALILWFSNSLVRVFWMLPHLVKDMLYCHHVNLVERVEVCASLLVLLP